MVLYGSVGIVKLICKSRCRSFSFLVGVRGVKESENNYSGCSLSYFFPNESRGHVANKRRDE